MSVIGVSEKLSADDESFNVHQWGGKFWFYFMFQKSQQMYFVMFWNVNQSMSQVVFTCMQGIYV